MIVSLWSWYLAPTFDDCVQVCCGECHDVIATYTTGTDSGDRWNLVDLTTAGVRHLADAHRPPLEREEKKS